MKALIIFIKGFFVPSVDAITSDFTHMVNRLDHLKGQLVAKNRHHIDAAWKHHKKATAALDEYSKADRVRNRIQQLIED